MDMETADLASGMSPVVAIALIGVLGVGSQWLAWKLRMPAIVLMLLVGVLAGPVLGLFDPASDLGPFFAPVISVAVAIILFEGGLSLNLHSLRDAAEGVRRLVYIGAPLGWLLSVLALRYGAGLGWESSAVFGGIMIVTGPTVIAPLLRTARLGRRTAALLQWEAIINDPIGALAAVLAYEIVVTLRELETWTGAVMQLVVGIGFAIALGVAAGFGLAWAFRRGHVPEFMKVPVLFALLLGVFAASDAVLHESGLLAVTAMGIVIANARLPSYEELRRFKEHATILLVSAVFILLAASIDLATLAQLNWRAGLFILLVVLVVRPLTVMASLFTTSLPWREQLLVAFTGPRGVVLVAIAGLFGERLVAVGVEDGALVAPLAFALVAVTVLVHGFTLPPISRRLGVVAAEIPGVLVVGGSRWTVELATALKQEEIPVLISDPNRSNLRRARSAGIEIFFGDILSEGAELRVELSGYKTLLSATDNDAYNTLVATDLALQFGRDSVYQVAREKADYKRHALPATLGGRTFADAATYNTLNSQIWQGWTFRITGLTDEYGIEDWRKTHPKAHLLGWIDTAGEIFFVSQDSEVKERPGVRMIAMLPPEEDEGAG